MANKQGEVLFKKEIKYPAAVGDWTQYKPEKPPFKRPSYIPYKVSKISQKELLKVLDVHSKFIVLFLESLQNSLKLGTELFTSSAEQLLYEDFLKRMDFPLLYAKLAIEEVGEIMLCIDFALINSLINFSLGCPNKVISPRNLTDVEESMIASIMENNLINLTSCWQDAFNKPELRVISCPGILKEPSINPGDVVTQFTSIISLGGSPPARLTFTYQSSLLRTLIGEIGTKNKEGSIDFSRIPPAILEGFSLPVTAELGETSITANELVSLETDDIIQVDTGLNNLLKVNIGGKIDALGQPGIKDNRLAVKLISCEAGAPYTGEKPMPVTAEPSEDLL
ncbi:FliM/FliN family flagellar motor switch protein [Candidatus Margulisiibacteriota bacterium]